MTKSIKIRTIKAFILSLVLIIAILTFTALSVNAENEDDAVISCDTETEVYLNGTDITEKTFSFTPDEDGNYAFYSSGDYDTLQRQLVGQPEKDHPIWEPTSRCASWLLQNFKEQDLWETKSGD